MLDRLHAPGRGDDDDLLPPGGPQDLLAGARGEDLLLSPAWLVDDDGLLPAHCGHLHARPQGLDPGLAAHADQIRAQGPHLGAAHTSLVDH